MEIFNKNVEVVGSLKVNALNAQGDLLTVDSVTNIITRRTTSDTYFLQGLKVIAVNLLLYK